MRLRIGTRASALARAQTEQVAQAMQAILPTLEVEFVEIVTHGDLSRGSLVGLSEAGVFVNALRRSLEDDDCDVLVHSLKDIPVAPAPGMTIAAIPERVDARDVLCAGGLTLDELPAGARVGTSSPRRKAQLLALRPDLNVLDLRGNVDSRLARVGSEYDGVILALAGLQRLGRAEVVDHVFDTHVMVPAPGQGALAIEIRDDAPNLVRELVAELDHHDTRVAVTAEREALRVLEAGCAAPMGAYATVHGGSVHLDVRVLNSQGRLALNERGRGLVEHAPSIGRTAGHSLLARGARSLLETSGA